MTRRGSEFSPRTKLNEWRAAGGCCRDCGRKLYAADRKEFDHDKPVWDHGTNDQSNCRLRCGWCHDEKTHRVEAPQRAERDRHQKRAAGAKAPSRNPLPGGRKSGWKKKINGEVVRREA